MRAYSNKGGKSGVVAFSLREDLIAVRFRDGTFYLYTVASTGKTHIEAMKDLALQGEGLSTYITQFVKEKFQTKLR